MPSGENDSCVFQWTRSRRTKMLFRPMNCALNKNGADTQKKNDTLFCVHNVLELFNGFNRLEAAFWVSSHLEPLMMCPFYGRHTTFLPIWFFNWTFHWICQVDDAIKWIRNLNQQLDIFIEPPVALSGVSKIFKFHMSSDNKNPKFSLSGALWETFDILWRFDAVAVSKQEPP